MPGSSTNQTLSFLRQRFAEAGIDLRKKLGQNFLIDLNLVRFLVQTAELGPDDVVLEVGTGTGSLTAMMAPQVAAVVTVEIDEHLFQLAAEELYTLPNVVMLQADALERKNRLSPAMLDAVRQQLTAAPGRRFKLVANLPYQIATPLMANLLDLDEPPRLMAVTIQKEVADRLVARPSTKDYGALAVWVQCQCRAEIVRVMPPEVFWPRPKVSSAIVRVRLDDELRGRIPDRAALHAFVRSMFLHRRKFLRSELIAATKGRLDKPQVDGLLAGLGLTGTERAESLTPDQMLALCEAVRRAATPPTSGPSN